MIKILERLWFGVPWTYEHDYDDVMFYFDEIAMNTSFVFLFAVSTIFYRRYMLEGDHFSI